MSRSLQRDIDRYAWNLKNLPKGYFMKMSAKELGISEAARAELIRMQEPKKRGRKRTGQLPPDGRQRQPRPGGQQTGPERTRRQTQPKHDGAPEKDFRKFR